MKTSRAILLTVLAVIFIQNQILRAQSTTPNAAFRGDTAVVSRPQFAADTSINLGLPLVPKQPAKFFLAVRSEFGNAIPSNFHSDLGFDIGLGDWVMQGDYRSYGGQPRPGNTTPPSGYDVLIVGWFPSGSPISTPIAPFPTTLDGINEYSLTVGKVFRTLNGTLVLNPTIGMAEVSRSYVHYSNCYQMAQPGTGLLLFFPFADTVKYNQYTATVENEVSITVPLSLHIDLEFSSWIGLSLSAWTEIGSGGTSGWSIGLEIGALP